MLFDNNTASPALLKVLEATGVKHDGTPLSIREATQATWYQAGKFRAEIIEQHPGLKEVLMPLFRELGLIDEIRASALEYDIALVLGATLTAVRKRLAFLVKEWKRGVRFKEIALLGSWRKLDPKKESREAVFDRSNPDLPIDAAWCNDRGRLLCTEGDMMAMVYEQVMDFFPWGHQIGFTVSVVPHPFGTTTGTVNHWKHGRQDAGIAPGHCLFVASQPFVADQELSIGEALHAGFRFEVIGYVAPPLLPVTTFLDTLAKTIFKLVALP